MNGNYRDIDQYREQKKQRDSAEDYDTDNIVPVLTDVLPVLTEVASSQLS